MTELDDRYFEILMIEDNPGDVLLVSEALKEEQCKSHLHWVKDGVEATSFLCQEHPFRNAPRPDLILLDLNLPRKNGFETLQFIKNNEQLKIIPVIVLTSSHAEADINASYKSHANCYVSKPSDLNQFMRLIRGINEFWFQSVRLPN